MSHNLTKSPSMTFKNTSEMEIELNDLQYHFERALEKSTAQMMKHISLLESCNATLSDKFELAQKKITALELHLAAIDKLPLTQTDTGIKQTNINYLQSLHRDGEHQQDQIVVLNS